MYIDHVGSGKGPVIQMPLQDKLYLHVLNGTMLDLI
jgi:hypothetical protein